MLKEDLRALNIYFFELVFRIFFDRGVSADILFRFSNWCYRHHLKAIAVLVKHFNIFINHCEIGYQCEIGKGFRIYHALGIVIGDVKMGENVEIFQNVTIGMSLISKHGQGQPIIGNNVKLYAGAVIAGGITVGDNVIVGANAVVVKDVPPNSTIIGGKPTIIAHV